MKIIVTGTEGYIGSILSSKLIQLGHSVTGIDTGFYRDGWLYSDMSTLKEIPHLINRDTRKVCPLDLKGADAIIHLAELSNDPLGEFNPEITFNINHKGTVRLAKIAKEAGVKKFIYTSSCSVYGASDSDIVTEESPTDPQTAYAKCKVSVENDVMNLADEKFSPVFLRNSTAYGASPRMRFDIVLNNLSGHAWTTNKILMTSDGSPWRPLVHINDICRAIVCTLDAPIDLIHNQVFNVGSNNQNYQVKEIAEIVASTFPDCQLSFGKSNGDNRSYKVSFDKIHAMLPEFSCEWNAEKGALQLKHLFERINLTQNDFEFRPYTRLKNINFLLNTKQIDNDLFWNSL